MQTLATAIGLTGGSLLLSDDLPALSEDRIRLAQVLTPLIEKRAMILDWFEAETPSLLRIDMSGPVGDWHILACFNWRDSPEALSFSPQEFKLAQGQTWWLREFWTGAVGKMDDNKPFICNNVPPHGVRVISARQFVADKPMYLGSDFHLSQGLEINDWQIDDDKVMLRFSLGRQATGKIDLYLPWQPEKTLAQKKSILLKDKDFGIYTIDLEIKNSTEIRIKRNTKSI